MSESVLADSIRSIDSTKIKVAFLNTSKSPPTPDFYIEEWWEYNTMELTISNNGDNPIQLDSVDLDIQHLDQIPILIQIDNVLSQEEIRSMQLAHSNWGMKVFPVNDTNPNAPLYWALSPTSSTTVEVDDTLTISFANLPVKDKPLRNGLVQTQLNTGSNEKLNFQQDIVLVNEPSKPLSDDLTVEFVNLNFDPNDPDDEKLANLVTRTPIDKGEPIKNTLFLQLKNKKNEPLVSEGSGSEARFFISFVASDYPENTPNALATAQEISAFDLSINKSESALGWGIQEISQQHVSYWELIPYKEAILDEGESFEFIISNIITQVPTGTTKLYFSYRGVVGYADGSIEVPIQIDATAAYIGTFLANGKTELTIPYGLLTISYAVHSSDTETWTISQNGKSIKSFNTKDDETLIKLLKLDVYDKGSYEFEIVNKSISPTTSPTTSKRVKVTATENKPPTIKNFYIEVDGKKTSNMTYGGKPFTLKWEVNSWIKGNVDWVILKYNGKQLLDFTSSKTVASKNQLDLTAPPISGNYTYTLISGGVSQTVTLYVEYNKKAIIESFRFKGQQKSYEVETGGDPFSLEWSVVSWDSDSTEWSISIYDSFPIPVFSYSVYKTTKPGKIGSSSKQFIAPLAAGQYKYTLSPRTWYTVNRSLYLEVKKTLLAKIINFGFGDKYDQELKVSKSNAPGSIQVNWHVASIPDVYWMVETYQGVPLFENPKKTFQYHDWISSSSSSVPTGPGNYWFTIKAVSGGFQLIKDIKLIVRS